MKLLIDCSTAKMGGARTYLSELLKVIPRRKGPHTWIVYGPAGFELSGSESDERVALRHVSGTDLSPLAYFWWLQRTLPKIIRRERIDVSFASTGFGMLNPSCPQVVLVRNPIYFSDLHESKIRSFRMRMEILTRRWISLRMIRQSQAVVFPTRAMKAMVERYLSLGSKRCRIVPYGCDANTFRQRDPSAEHGFPAELLQARGRFLLNVSLYCGQKNFTVLFQALGILRQRRLMPPLALTTRLNPAPNCNFREDQAIIRQQNLEQQLIQLGPVPRQQLPALYQAAGLFLFPSYVESFGHPLVEAMAAGLPIVAADTPVNREICGEAALYAHPFDPEDWAGKIAQGLTEDPLRQRLVHAAMKRVEDFSWESHLEGLLRLCEEIVQEKPG